MGYSLCLRTAGRYLRYGLVGALMLTASPARAASVSFFLDQSNTLPDGTDYLSVMLTDNGLGGVDFLVQTLNPLNSVAGRNFGIQKFAFSFLDESWGQITNLPKGWSVRNNQRMDGFGKFDIRLQGKGKARTDSLSFTVNNVTLDDFDSLMTAQAAGFEWCRIDERRHKACGDKDCTTSAYFAGRMGDLPPPDPTTTVPAPAAAWLLGSGLAGLFGLVSRRRTRTTRSEQCGG